MKVISTPADEQKIEKQDSAEEGENKNPSENCRQNNNVVPYYRPLFMQATIFVLKNSLARIRGQNRQSK